MLDHKSAVNKIKLSIGNKKTTKTSIPSSAKHKIRSPFIKEAYEDVGGN